MTQNSEQIRECEQMLKEQWRSISLFFGLPLLLLLWKAPRLEFYLTSADHGYQLSLGKQILFDRFPFIDQFFHYGPLTAFTSAFGLWISDSLIPETIICAIGYAAAIFFIHRLSLIYASKLASYILPIVSFLLIARFYKWYYWLFPLIALYCFHRFLVANPPQKFKVLYIAGIFGGIGGLYRFDLGLATLCLYTLLLLGLCLKPFNLKLFGREIAAFGLGLVLPYLLWFLALSLAGGTVKDFFSALFVGKQGIVKSYALPVPPVDWSHIFSVQSGTAFGFWLLPTTCLLCIAVGGWAHWRRSEPTHPKWIMMVASGLLGLGLSPQAFYRADVHHLLQVLPPVLLSAGMLVTELRQRAKLLKQQRSLQGLLVVYLVILTIAGLGMRAGGGIDLAQWEWNPLPRYQHLSQGIKSNIDHPVIRLMQAVQHQTQPSDRILVVPLACQLYYFADRPMSGLLNGYTVGNIDSPYWRDRNLKAVQAAPPSVIIAQANFFNLPPTDLFRLSQPELYDFLTKTYTKVTAQQDAWILLSQPAN